MKVVWKASLLVGLLLLLSACQTNIKNIALPIGQEPQRINPVNVQTEYINVQALEPQALDIASGDLFANGGFESGLEGWTACSAGAIKPSSDAYESSGALEVVPDNCFYRSAEVSPGQDLVLSCYVKVTSGNAWTGMGMGFADSSWSTVGETPATIISGSAYARYDVEFTAPANSKYASMWLYSENAAVVDNCSLMLEAAPPPPPPPSGDNLLENGGFETLSNGNPTEWSQGCGGSASSVTGREGNGFNLKGGICVDQGLSAGDIAALSGNDYTYSCYAKNTGGYASLSIFFDDDPISKQIPVSNSYQLVEITGTAPNASSGFMSIYSEGNLTVDQCSLVTDDVTSPQPPNEENLLKNGDFEILDTNEKPVNWTKGCGGEYLSSGRRNGKTLSLTGGSCVSQSLSSTTLNTISGRQYTFSCYVSNFGGYASISVFFDGQSTSTVIPENSGYQLVKLTNFAPTASSGFVSIYSEADFLFVDNCSLTIGPGSVPSPRTITENRVVNVNTSARFPQDNIYDIENNLLAVGFPAEISQVSGKVITYIQSETSWTQQNTIESPFLDSQFGRAVKLDGELLYITGLNDLYIFKNIDNQWSFQQNISYDEAVKPNFLINNLGESFGTELFINKDVAIVKSTISTSSFSSAGTYDLTNIYTRNQDSWQYLRSISSLNIIQDVKMTDDYIFISTVQFNGADREIVVLDRNTGGDNNWGVIQTITDDANGVTNISNFGGKLNSYKGNLIVSAINGSLVYFLDSATSTWEFLGTFSDVYRDLEELTTFIPLSNYNIIGIIDDKLFLKHLVRARTTTLNTNVDAIDIIDASGNPSSWNLIAQINTESLGVSSALNFQIEKEISAFAITGIDTNSVVGFPLP